MIVTEQKKTCETCRFINYTRRSDDSNGPVRDLACGNSELDQMAKTETGKPLAVRFQPPRLAFSCNRWMMRKPELGFVPDFVRDES